jgi:squalene cyclase
MHCLLWLIWLLLMLTIDFNASSVLSVQQLGDGQSGVVQTAWALLTLMAAGCENRAAIDRGIAFLMSKQVCLTIAIVLCLIAILTGRVFSNPQLSSGDWDQEGITGVFNRSCGITYTAYRNVFPMWALSRYSAHYDINSQ